MSAVIGSWWRTGRSAGAARLEKAPHRSHLNGGRCSQKIDRPRRVPDIYVQSDPYPIQFGSGDWITVVTNATGTFTGEMVLPDGKVIAGTGKSFDVEFGQTTKWDGDQLVIISAFWNAALLAKQIGLA